MGNEIKKAKLKIHYTCPACGVEVSQFVKGKNFTITPLANSYRGDIDIECPVCEKISTYEIE